MCWETWRISIHCFLETLHFLNHIFFFGGGGFLVQMGGTCSALVVIVLCWCLECSVFLRSQRIWSWKIIKELGTSRQGEIHDRTNTIANGHVLEIYTSYVFGEVVVKRTWIQLNGKLVGCAMRTCYEYVCLRNSPGGRQFFVGIPTVSHNCRHWFYLFEYWECIEMDNNCNLCEFSGPVQSDTFTRLCLRHLNRVSGEETWSTMVRIGVAEDDQIGKGGVHSKTALNRSALGRFCVFALPQFLRSSPRVSQESEAQAFCSVRYWNARRHSASQANITGFSQEFLWFCPVISDQARGKHLFRIGSTLGVCDLSRVAHHGCMERFGPLSLVGSSYLFIDLQMSGAQSEKNESLT